MQISWKDSANGNDVDSAGGTITDAYDNLDRLTSENRAQGEKMMAKRTSTKRTIGILCILIAATMLVVAWHGVHRVNPKKLDALIRQKLPLGTDETSVITFLNLQHIVHTDYDPQRKMIQAGISKSSIGLITGRIHIDFWFDENGKLLRYDLVELFDFL